MITAQILMCALANFYSQKADRRVNEWQRTIWQFVIKEQVDVSFSYVCPVIYHEVCHNTVKVVVDPQGDSGVDLLTTLTMLWQNSWSITEQTHEKLTSICWMLGMVDGLSIRGLTVVSDWCFDSLRRSHLFQTL